jgi:hypothetical protein
MAARKYSILHIPVMSFFSKDLYRDVGLNWRGTCLGYLLLLLAVCWIPWMVKTHMGLSKFVKDYAPKIVSQVPTITIKDGLASIDEPQPYYILVPDTNDVFIIIDTTGTITSLADSNALVLITKTEVIFAENEGETFSFADTDIKDFTLSQAKLNRWLNTLQKLAVPVMYPLALAFSYAYRIIQALIYAAVGLLFAHGFKTKIEYPAMLRLAVAAVTPAIIVNTITSLAGIASCGMWMLYLGIALGYLAFGVHSISEARQQVDEPTFGPPPTQFHDQL